MNFTKAAITAATLLLSILVAHAQSELPAWIATGSGAWNNPLNWSTSSVPTSGKFPGNSSTPSTIDLGSELSVGTLFFEGPSGSGQYTVGAGPIGSQKLKLFNNVISSGTPVVFNADISLYTGSLASTVPFGGSYVINGAISGGSAFYAWGQQILFYGSAQNTVQIHGKISNGTSWPVSVKFENSSGTGNPGFKVDIYSPNTYTGMTELSGATLSLHTENAFSSKSNLSLYSSILDTKGFDQQFGIFSAVANSAIDFASIANLLFADSSAVAWGGALELKNFEIGSSSLRFGTSNTALTTDQLSKILLPGYNASLDDQGYVVFTAIPEPGTLALFSFSLAGLGLAARRNWRARSE